MDPDAGSVAPEVGVTMYNTSGNDDDCKYSVSFTVTTVRQGQDVSFMVMVNDATSQAPITGANVRAEVYLSDTHPAPNSGTTTTEEAGGMYTVAPVRFDASGRWTVRFHVFENCSDLLEDSPHGHAAFYIDVP